MRIYWKTLCLATSLGSLLHADTIVLKSGKTHEGRVLSEDLTSYLFEIKVSNTITDERRISKDLIKEIIKESADSKSFKIVATLIPTPDLLTAKAYPKRISIAKEFLTKFPQSKHKAEAKKILTLLETEHQTISDGGLKLDGQLISHSDIEANAYDIHARMLVRDMDRLVSTRQYREALRKWEILQTDYKNSTSFKRAIPTARRALRAYRGLLKQLADTLDARNAARKSAIASMNENDRERTEAALMDQQKKHAELIEKEKTQLKLKWLTVDSFSKESIDHNYRQTETSFSTIKTHAGEITLAGPTYRDAWIALAKNNFVEAEKHIKNLQSIKIPKRYIEPLQTKLLEKQKSHQEEIDKAKTEAAAEKAKQEEESALKEAEKGKQSKKGKRKKKSPAKP